MISMEDTKEIREDEFVLLVGKRTSPASLRTAAVAQLKMGRTVHLDCIGVAANYIATKSLILIRAYMSTMGKELKYIPIYKDFVIKDSKSNVKTGIRWTLQID